MARGILEMFGWVTIALVAIPPAFAGAGVLIDGNLTIGATLLGVAFAMVVADQYITTPSDLPALLASKLVGIVVRQPDEEE
ncbi:hypothetical protein ACFQJ7_14090 [Halovenus rubra]|uniref:Uncharacterized protein n=2 Tax=Halovenus rubra TaxID=869890 RepID=A0ACC7DYY1_9EURY|nr:hypothetical protein [Halovenus rubra]